MNIAVISYTFNRPEHDIGNYSGLQFVVKACLRVCRAVARSSAASWMARKHGSFDNGSSDLKWG